MTYFVHLLTIANIYVLLAVSLDLLVGLTGLMSLAHAMFFGIGAYATAS
jgi:branched-chain amino acid transport system permease protein